MTRLRRPFASGASHTPLFDAVRRAFRIAAISNRPDAPPADELVQMQREGHLSRRTFLKGTTAAAVLVGAGAWVPGCGKTGSEPPSESVRVAIVGAGIAGLNAAYKLKKAGYAAAIYDANSRNGGRIYTARDIMAPGLTTELGGEFIDSTHTEMLALCTELSLPLLDTRQPSEKRLGSQAFFFEGRHYGERQVIRALKPFVRKIQADYDSLPEVVDFKTPGDAGTLDRMSVTQYFDSLGIKGWLRKLLDVAYVTEYGLDTDQQSALNFVFQIGTDMDYSGGEFKTFGESDERYKIQGGNQQVVDQLASRLDGQIKLGHRLEAIRPRGAGYTLTFQRKGASPIDINADVAIIAIPFSLLRSVDTARLPFPDAKKRAIAELGYGTNAKIMAGFKQRLWRDKGYTGYIFTDEALQSGWDNSQLQPGSAGGFTFLLAGTAGLDSGSGTAASQVDALMPGFEKIYSGVTAARNGATERFHWPSFELAKGSYACYKPGQWTTIAGAEGMAVGNLLFAGEHCSYDFQGFMNGGAETGKAAAEAAVALLGKTVVSRAQT